MHIPTKQRILQVQFIFHSNCNGFEILDYVCICLQFRPNRNSSKSLYPWSQNCVQFNSAHTKAYCEHLS